jgi:thioredoxin 1
MFAAVAGRKKIDLHPEQARQHLEGRSDSRNGPLLRGFVMSNAQAVNDSTFDAEVLKSSTPVLVDFWAPWCGPCRAVAPTVDAIAGEFAGKLKVVKINTDESGEVAMKYGVTSIPTLMVFKGGDVVERVLGNRPKADLAAMVSRHL